MDPFVAQLASLCRPIAPATSGCSCRPTHVGRTLGERIALGGTSWLNLRFVTPLDIALRMGAPFLVERGIEPSEEGLGPALIMRLLLDLPEEGGYFRPLADQPTLAQALWATIRELRMAGIKSDDLTPEAFASPEKHAELRALLASYEQFSRPTTAATWRSCIEEALKHPDWCPIQPADCWTELPDVVWTPLQRQLIDAMPGERIVPAALAIPGATIPRRLRAESASSGVRRAPRPPRSRSCWRQAAAGVTSRPEIPDAAPSHDRPVPCGRKRSRGRRSLPPHSGLRHITRPGGDRAAPRPATTR